MAFSSGAQRDLYYVVEDSYGVPPATVAMTEVRNTEDTISLVRDSFVSDERRGDRGIHDMRLGNKQPAGDISFEFSYGAFDDFLEGALGGTWSGNVLKKGSTLKSFAIEKAFTDITQYQYYTGGVVNTFNLEIAPNAMITGSFGMLFRDAENGSSAYHNSTSGVSTNRPFDGFTGSILEGGGSIAEVSSMSLSLDNGFERNFVLMSNSAPQMTSGKSNITGSVTLYFANSTVYDKFVNETESSLAITLEDNLGNSYLINLPRIKYTSADTPVSSDGAIINTMNFQALDDAVQASNIVITRTTA